MEKINLTKKKILFLGYGAVAKCVWNLFDRYFVYNRKRVVLVDKSKNTFYGPGIKGIKKKVLNVDSTTFDDLIVSLSFKKGDVIIDLTTSSSTYYFVKQCLLNGFHYINTSIEDDKDKMAGQSIDCQQQTILEIAKGITPQSNVLIECGQNPGLIQHYVLHAFEQLKKESKVKTDIDIIKKYKIGTILMSEIDALKRVSTTPLQKDLIYNTWSVAGYIAEAIDCTELVRGKKNKYIQPVIKEESKNELLMKLYPSMGDYEVVFLNDIGMNTSLQSICPVLATNKIEFQNYQGKLVHHGEMFELARYFGEYAPFMTYVYRTNEYADQSIKTFIDKYEDINDCLLYVNQPDTFEVFDNIKHTMSGYDSIGCTIFCGDKKVDRMFWCGSVLCDEDVDAKEFTPTIVQVAAGVLSGLSFILEPEYKNMGLIEPLDMDTEYILKKSVPLLGKFMFLEIPVDKFHGFNEKM